MRHSLPRRAALTLILLLSFFHSKLDVVAQSCSVSSVWEPLSVYGPNASLPAVASTPLIHIAAAYSITGANSNYGPAQQQAMQLWVDTANSKGGQLINGTQHYFQLTWADDGSSTAYTYVLFDRWSRSTSPVYDALVASWTTSMSAAAVAAAKPWNRTVLIAGGSGPTLLTGAYAYAYSIEIIATHTMDTFVQTGILPAVAADVQNVLTLYRDNPYSSPINAELKAAMISSWPVANYTQYNLTMSLTTEGTQTFVDALSPLSNPDAPWDVIMMTTNSVFDLEFVSQALPVLGWTPKLCLFEEFYDDSQATLNRYYENWISVWNWHAGMNFVSNIDGAVFSTTDQLAELMQQVYQTGTLSEHVQVVALMDVWISALNATQTTNYAAVHQAILALNGTTVLGGFRLSPTLYYNLLQTSPVFQMQGGVNVMISDPSLLRFPAEWYWDFVHPGDSLGFSLVASTYVLSIIIIILGGWVYALLTEPRVETSADANAPVNVDLWAAGSSNMGLSTTNTSTHLTSKVTPVDELTGGVPTSPTSKKVRINRLLQTKRVARVLLWNLLSSAALGALAIWAATLVAIDSIVIDCGDCQQSVSMEFDIRIILLALLPAIIFVNLLGISTRLQVLGLRYFLPVGSLWLALASFSSRLTLFESLAGGYFRWQYNSSAQVGVFFIDWVLSVPVVLMYFCINRPWRWWCCLLTLLTLTLVDFHVSFWTMTFHYSSQPLGSPLGGAKYLVSGTVLLLTACVVSGISTIVLMYLQFYRVKFSYVRLSQHLYQLKEALRESRRESARQANQIVLLNTINAELHRWLDLINLICGDDFATSSETGLSVRANSPQSMKFSISGKRQLQGVGNGDSNVATYDMSEDTEQELDTLDNVARPISRSHYWWRWLLADIGAGSEVSTFTAAWGSPKTSLAIKHGGPLVTLKEVVRHAVTFCLFKRFVETNAAVENVQFLWLLRKWQAMEVTADTVFECITVSWSLCQQFIASDSTKQLNLDARMRDKILEKARQWHRTFHKHGAVTAVKERPMDLFTDAEKETWRLLESNYWINFQKTPSFVLCKQILRRHEGLREELKKCAKPETLVAGSDIFDSARFEGSLQSSLRVNSATGPQTALLQGQDSPS